jgi:hypothetical protein
MAESDDAPENPTATMTGPPDPMTEECSQFFDEHWQLASFLLFVMMLAVEKDETERRLARLTLQHGNLPDSDREKIVPVTIHGIGAWQALMTREQTLLQFMLCRAVDNFLSYISELLALLFSSRPETLLGEDKVSYDEILQFQTLEELIGYLAETKVHELSYKGMRELAKYLSKRLGFAFCQDQQAFDRIVLVIEMRNLITHNRGVVNRIFKRRQPSFPADLRTVITLEMTQTVQDIDLLARSVCDIEERAGAKWGLRRPVPRKVHDERMKGLFKSMEMFELALENMRKQAQQEREEAGPFSP